MWEVASDGGEIGCGGDFLAHRFIERSLECGAISTKELLDAGGGPPAPRKAAPSLRKEVGQNIKETAKCDPLGKKKQTTENACNPRQLM